MPARSKMEGYTLGNWVSVQRNKQDRLSHEFRQRLDDVGFIWDPFSEAWEEGFGKLLQFKELEGHCRVPQKFKLDGVNLGNWVSHQRMTKDRLSPERKQRLDDIGFIWDASKDKT